MKPTILVLSSETGDRDAIARAARTKGCRMVAHSSAQEALASVSATVPSVIFCDARLAGGGSVLRSFVKACGLSAVPIVLIVPAVMKAGFLKALRPWVDDYLTTPVFPEAAAVRIANALGSQRQKGAEDRAETVLRQWLACMENAAQTFEPLSYDHGSAQDELAEITLTAIAQHKGGPEYLLIAVPGEDHTLRCDIYSAVPAFTKITSGLSVPETAVFLWMRNDGGLISINRTSMRRRLGCRQALPPELVQVTGEISSLAGTFHAGVFVLALNYAKRISLEDAMTLRGLALPYHLLGAVSREVQDMSDSFLVLMQALALATDSPGDQGAHVRRMNEYARVLAERMGLPERFVNTISYSAQLHDVGKIYIHPDVLEKPVRLTQREIELIRKHPLLGARLLGISPLLQVARNIALTHHECWDGSGYPAGLNGEAIPIEGAIVKIADVYDALRTMYSYKSARSHAEACALILDGGGSGFHSVRPSHFHPDVLQVFREAAPVFEKIYDSHSA